MSKEKWDAISKFKSNDTVLAADTIVVLGSKILGKAKNATEAKKILKSLSGKKHFVITAVCMGSKSNLKTFEVSTAIRFRKISDEEIKDYLRSGEWKDKAGAYGIQGKAKAFVEEIRGSLTNVIGLPLEKVLIIFGT